MRVMIDGPGKSLTMTTWAKGAGYESTSGYEIWLWLWRNQGVGKKALIQVYLM